MVRQTANNKADASPPDAELTQEHLVCTLHGGLYGFEVSRVRYISTVGRIWRLPLVPDYVKGVTRIRGRLIPLVDLRLKLGLPEAAYHGRTCVVETKVSVPIAVAVDSVESVRHFAEREIVPASRFGMGIGSRAVTGIVPMESRLCVLLDLDWILLGRSSCACGKEAAGVVRPTVGRSQRCEASNNETAVSSGYTDAPKSKAPKVVALVNRDATVAAQFQADRTMRALLRFAPDPSQRFTCRLALVKASDPACEERLIGLLAKPVFAGKRRIPGFRPGDPRLSALAIALLDMPSTFQTKCATPAVAALLGRSSEDYRVTHFRYDLAKLRARHLAERIGISRHYRLTKIGRLVCETMENGSVAADLPRARVTIPLQAGVSALSA
ncbi:MAG: purine-binding chemotaxis protein CheW [bacterium]|nr:purine-binding chemotaxis protein CheW [bacterium]